MSISIRLLSQFSQIVHPAGLSLFSSSLGKSLSNLSPSQSLPKFHYRIPPKEAYIRQLQQHQETFMMLFTFHVHSQQYKILLEYRLDAVYVVTLGYFASLGLVQQFCCGSPVTGSLFYVHILQPHHQVVPLCFLQLKI